MKNKNTVIFDLDGTLLDTLDDLTISVNWALASVGYPVHTKESICSFVGNGILELIRKSVPSDASEEMFQKVLEHYKEYYAQHSQDHTKLYKGIVPLIETLKEKGYKMAIVSNKHHEAVMQLKPIYFEGLIDVAIGQQEGISRKPAPDAVYRAIEVLGSDVASSVYIGDSEVDYETAVNAGMDVILVTWGFRTQEALEALGANDFAHRPSDVLDLLEHATV